MTGISNVGISSLDNCAVNELNWSWSKMYTTNWLSR